ncbi:MAG TPA: flagellar motor protein MotB [Symbiobacteriaceae bacterium]|jgi:chemotaxis protein MotB|nr:flagellar motor protein MotB [Symbiobacteriaceae bacterium]
MSGKKHKKHAANHERWLLTYSDMITLLMALFIMLFAMSKVDQGKYQAVANMLSQVMGGGNMIINTGGVGDGVNVPPTTIDAISNISPEQVKDALEQLGEGLYADFARDGRFTVYVGQRGLTISLAGNAFFDSGKATLRPEVLPLLNDIADRLKALPNDISLEGFADSDPIKTSEFPSNWHLSTARALAVRDYLEGRGVQPERMILVGYGDKRPVFSNETAEGKAKNRRVDVVILRERQELDLGQEIKTDKK